MKLFEQSEKWQIIGSGAIGCLWAANFIKSGQQVRLISRHQDLPGTLVYQDLQGEQYSLKCPQSQYLNNSNSPILVCVKAPQVLQALLDQQKHISNTQVIILMHNGMGTAELVAKQFPNNPIICATTSNACLLNGPFNITQTGLGITYLGAFNQQANAYDYLLPSFNKALNNCHWNDEVEKNLWLKLLINIAINPLTAIHQVNNGALSQSIFQQQINQMIDEALPVLDKIGIDSSEENNNAFCKTNLMKTINQVITNTADNYSSMNRDIFYKRPTENQYINGYILKVASQFNLETPTIRDLYLQVIALEKA